MAISIECASTFGVHDMELDLNWRRQGDIDLPRYLERAGCTQSDSD
jgi:hypothetical protein